MVVVVVGVVRWCCMVCVCASCGACVGGECGDGACGGGGSGWLRVVVVVVGGSRWCCMVCVCVCGFGSEFGHIHGLLCLSTYTPSFLLIPLG